jgi:lipopolysaccharide transport system ATP-binding protein
MSSEIAIAVQGLGKTYPMYARPYHRLFELLLGRRDGRWRREHRALRDVSFEVKRGETLGIIGRNGSGKSTLLQILCGTLEATEGDVIVNGRVAALLELGAGFNPEFTGRENVFLYGTVLGLTREQVAQRFEAIERFADIGAFIDEPVRTYSSGMFVRLAFAVAIHVDPDVLIVDEALSVGDEAFQRKCFGRIAQLRDGGCTILFVSHSAGTVIEICDRALLMDGGEAIAHGAPRELIAQYQKLIHSSGEHAALVRDKIVKSSRMYRLEPSEFPAPARGVLNVAPHDDGDDWDANLEAAPGVEYERRGATIRGARLETSEGRRVNVCRQGARYLLRYRIDFDRMSTGVRFGMMLRTVTGVDVCGAVSSLPADAIAVIDAGLGIDATIEFRCQLAPGTYFVSMGVLGREAASEVFLDRRVDALSFRVVQCESWLGTGLVDMDVETRYAMSSNKEAP